MKGERSRRMREGETCALHLPLNGSKMSDDGKRKRGAPQGKEHEKPSALAGADARKKERKQSNKTESPSSRTRETEHARDEAKPRGNGGR